MTDRKLTERQKIVLTYLRRRNIEHDGAPTGFEIAAACWGTGAFTAYEQGQRTCKQLVARGLVVPLGVSPTGARCFAAAPTV